MSGEGASFDELEGAYRRVSRALYRAQEDALDFLAETIIEALEREQTIIEAAFFILIFGQIEFRINELAAIRLTRSDQQAAIRERPFRRRLAIALPGARFNSTRNEMGGWYDRWNRVAHGETVTGFDLGVIFRRARELEYTIAQQTVDLQNDRGLAPHDD